MKKKLLIKNALVICPKQNIEERLDILIEKGKFKKLQKKILDTDAKIIEASGKIVFPGIVDPHCHIKEFNREENNNFKSIIKSALCGGYTAITCMPKMELIMDNHMGIKYILSQSKKLSLLNIYPIAAITHKLEGKKLTDIATLSKSGAIAFSDDDHSIMDSFLMRKALEYTKMFDIPIITHCEDPYLSENGVVNEGYVSTYKGFKGIPSISETLMVSRDVLLAEFTKSRLHIAYISTKQSVEIIRQAKKRKVNVTCGVTPHHLSLTEENVLKSNYNTNTKVNPPLRSNKDRLSLIQGLKDGTIDTICSNHSPYSSVEKEVEYIKAPYGIINLETTIPILFKELIKTKYLNLKNMARIVSYNPTKIFKLEGGSLNKGSVANLTIIDPEFELKITKNFYHSISKNSPYLGMKLKGFCIYTIIQGKIIYKRSNH